MCHELPASEPGEGLKSRFAFCQAIKIPLAQLPRLQCFVRKGATNGFENGPALKGKLLFARVKDL